MLHLGSRPPDFRQSLTILIQTLNQPKYNCYQINSEIQRTVHNHVVTLLADKLNAISSSPFCQFISLSGTAGSQMNLEGVCCQDKGTETGRGSRHSGLLDCFNICDHTFAALSQDNKISTNFPFPSKAEPVCSGSFLNSEKSISKPRKQSKCKEENASLANLDFPEQHLCNDLLWVTNLHGSVPKPVSGFVEIHMKPKTTDQNTDTSLCHRNYTC